jgi:hypothetical protein
MSGWDGLIEIFNPQHKHLAEELETKRIEAQIPGSEADPNKTYVDLDRGIVHLALPPERFRAAWTADPAEPSTADEDAEPR